jgi:hypothetical protein
MFGRNRLLAGGPAALRVVIRNHTSRLPVRALVTADLVAETKNNAGKAVSSRTSRLFSGRTDYLGTIDGKFTAPQLPNGAYKLRLRVVSSIGSDEIDRPVEIGRDTTVMLTCDKPIYQPSQVVHMRALALDTATREPVTDVPMTFEVEDARGNKVFKQSEALSRFGVASADFVLADEVNMGTFTLRTILGDTQTEKKVTVQRYVLPKYKITMTSDKPYALPGQVVSGTVTATYTFGKPVADAKIHVDFSTIDIGVSEISHADGITSSNGTYRYKFTAPTSLIGQPFEQGKAVLEMNAHVTDTANQSQDSSMDVPVVKDPLLVALVPETQSVVPGVANRVYIAVARPDGTPIPSARIIASVNGRQIADLNGDSLGLAAYDFRPDPAANQEMVHVHAEDKTGHSAGADLDLSASSSSSGIILRTDKTLARVGDQLHIAALCSNRTGTCYVDVIRDKQTILTQAVPINRGAASSVIALSNDMAGTLELHAYEIMPNEDIVRDTRTMVVSPANELTVEATADRLEYRPGETAALRFTVADKTGAPVSAAIGLGIVDESVFALSELQPGLEKIYFTLEKELMEPKYEIHGLTPSGLLLRHFPTPGPIRPIGEPSVAPDTAPEQRAAAMLLAGAPSSSEFDYRVDTFDTRWQKVRTVVVTEMTKAARKISNAIERYRQSTGSTLSTAAGLQTLVEKGYLQRSDLTDRWGDEYRTDTYGRGDYGYFTISSAGPDRIWGTNDDIGEISPFGERQMFENGVVALNGAGGGFAAPVQAEVRLEAPTVVLASPQPATVAPAPAPAPMAIGRTSPAVPTSLGIAQPRVRYYFPETLYWNPAVITDFHGHASLSLPLADSITTWRASMIASSLSGELGSATSLIKVFQEFFVDIDFPLTLTQHDEVDVPVSVYNYLKTAQDVSLTVQSEPWFSVSGSETKTVHVDAGQVMAVSFPMTIKLIGEHSLTVTAKGSRMSDAVRRNVTVLPDGKEYAQVINDRVEKTADKTVTVPANAIDGGTSVWVKLYPGTFSQVAEGLDGILSMPNGCFEQTSSTTYPDVLVLSYLKANKKVNPEIQMKAEQYINVGYQRLVTFECKSGGFSWFGDEPAHQILTAYGLLEFTDMAKVHAVDPALIDRTANWLAARQKPNGTWEETSQGIAEGIINRQTGALRSTAYVAWALAESGYKGPALQSALAYVKAHAGEANDAYTLAVLVNYLVAVDPTGATTSDVADKLIGMAKVVANTAYWESDTETFTGARTEGADLETTGLAAYGLAKWGRNASFINKVLTHLVQTKNQFGVWDSTQGTVWSLKALLYASSNSVSGGTGNVTVEANGRAIGSDAITRENSDVMRQFKVPVPVTGSNRIEIKFDGDGSLLYQIVGRYYIPWDQVQSTRPSAEPLSISVDYDKRQLAQDDTATVSVTIKNNTALQVDMPLVDVGVPPGFAVVTDALDKAVSQATVSKYTVAERQIIIYLLKLNPNQIVRLHYQIRAKYPVNAVTPLSKVYPYYNPEKASISGPQKIVVTR